MRRLLIVSLAVVALVASLEAATYIKFESIAVSSTAIGFTATNINQTGAHLAATQAVCIVTTAAVNYQIDGTTTVTSATTGGQNASVGTPIILLGNDILNNFRAIASTATAAVLNCTYSRP